MRVFDQLRHQVHPLYRMVFGRRRKASSHPARQHTDHGWDQRECDGLVKRDCGEAHRILRLYTVNVKTSITSVAPAQCLGTSRMPMAGVALETCSDSCPQRWARFVGTKMRLRSGNVQSLPSIHHVQRRWQPIKSKHVVNWVDFCSRPQRPSANQSHKA